MKTLLKITAMASLGITLAPVAAQAQSHHRTVVTTHRTVVTARRTGWHAKRHQVCSTHWRHHHRVRSCHWA